MLLGDASVTQGARLPCGALGKSAWALGSGGDRRHREQVPGHTVVDNHNRKYNDSHRSALPRSCAFAGPYRSWIERINRNTHVEGSPMADTIDNSANAAPPAAELTTAIGFNPFTQPN